MNLETIADVSLNGTDKILVQSEGYPAFKVDLTDLSVHRKKRIPPLPWFTVWLLLLQRAAPG